MSSTSSPSRLAAAASVPTEASRLRSIFIGIADPIDTPVYDQDALTADASSPARRSSPPKTPRYLVEPGWRLEPTPQGAVWFLQD